MAAARRASGGGTPSASVWNLLIIGALTLLVVLLAAERSTMAVWAVTTLSCRPRKRLLQSARYSKLPRPIQDLKLPPGMYTKAGLKRLPQTPRCWTVPTAWR